MEKRTWTLSELAELAARALAGAGVQAVSGRVTGVPDGRLIRWYTTIGLLGRPEIGPDRFARYGLRHLLQLVAVKRLQAQGLPLAQIQARLVGATDARLRQLAALPAGLLDGDGAARAEEEEPFWARRPAPASQPPAPAAPARPAPAPAPGPPTVTATAPAAPDGRPAVDASGDTVARTYGLRLSGLTLLLPAEPSAADIDAIVAAARPLLHVLAERGLATPTEGAPR